MLLRTRIAIVIAVSALAFSQASFAQTTTPAPAPKTQTQKPPPAPMPKATTDTARTAASSGAAQQGQNRVIVVEPIRVYDPFFAYPYPYAYPPDYMAQNFGYIKLKTDRKDGSVYVDGGFADKIEKAKKFALRPGNHDIEVRDSDERTLFRERVQVIVGKTTELHVG